MEFISRSYRNNMYVDDVLQNDLKGLGNIGLAIVIVSDGKQSF